MGHKHHHHECHSEEGCCGHHHHHECSHDASCHENSCHSECHHHEGDFSESLLHLADEAWMEVLKEKIKENIRNNNDPHLHDLAKSVSEANKERWKLKMGIKKTHSDLKNKLNAIFGCNTCK